MHTYKWRHIQTGEEGTKNFSANFYFDGVLAYHSELDRMRKVNEWNRKGLGLWLYWIP